MRTERDTDGLAPVFIVGATASRKSDTAMMIAREFHGEIVCLDKTTAWCEMDIGTAKPSIGDRTEVAHNLVDIFHMGLSFPNSPDIIARNALPIMVEKARERVQALSHLGVPSICVGGSGVLYDGLYSGLDFPTTAPFLERQLDLMMEDLAGLSVAGLQRHMQERAISLPFIPREPAYLSNPSRVQDQTVSSMDNVTFKEEDAITLHGQILEAAIRKTGSPSWPKALVVGIGSESKALTERITSRTDRMIEMGLVGEVASLAQKYPWPMPLRYTIGYRELRPYVEDSTNNSLDDAIDMINDDTMRYARRQRAWFARRPEIRWTDSPEEAAEIAIQHLHDQGL